MNNAQQLEKISLPHRLFESMIDAQRKWQEFSEELEDFLASSDLDFVRKMRKARQEHLEGKTRVFKELKQELQ